MSEKKVEGVGLLLFVMNGGPRLAVVKELVAKPQYSKQAGMLSFPLETVEAYDDGLLGTVWRLIKEELGKDISSLVTVLDVIEEPMQLIPGRPDINTYYGYGIFHGSREQILQPQSDDITFAGWLAPEDLLARPLIRVEVVPVWTHFIQSGHYEKLLKQLSKAA